MAFWPRDRLVGLRASAQGGVLHTVPHIAGRRLHINADASGPGEIVAELVGEDGRPMAGYGVSNAEPLRTDALDHTFRWRDASHGPTDRAVAVRLHITRAEVFSMWWD
jgi:hypothetical protein